MSDIDLLLNRPITDAVTRRKFGKVYTIKLVLYSSTADAVIVKVEKVHAMELLLSRVTAKPPAKFPLSFARSQ